MITAASVASASPADNDQPASTATVDSACSPAGQQLGESVALPRRRHGTPGSLTPSKPHPHHASQPSPGPKFLSPLPRRPHLIQATHNFRPRQYPVRTLGGRDSDSAQSGSYGEAVPSPGNAKTVCRVGTRGGARQLAGPESRRAKPPTAPS